MVDSFTWSRHPDGVICRNIWGNGVGAWDFEPSPFAHTGCASTALKTGSNTPATGRNGCRSYAWVSVRGARGVQNMWVFNNIVKFN